MIVIIGKKLRYGDWSMETGTNKNVQILLSSLYHDTIQHFYGFFLA